VASHQGVCKAYPSAICYSRILFLYAFYISGVDARPRLYTLGAANSAFQSGVLMLDAILIAVGIGFFVVAIAYTFACDEL
jgi:hypothetical protein